MAMTKEEIGQERVRFEKWHLPRHGFSGCYLLLDGEDIYIWHETQVSFESWLAAKQDSEQQQLSNSK